MFFLSFLFVMFHGGVLPLLSRIFSRITFPTNIHKELSKCPITLCATIYKVGSLYETFSIKLITPPPIFYAWWWLLNMRICSAWIGSKIEDSFHLVQSNLNTTNSVQIRSVTFTGFHKTWSSNEIPDVTNLSQPPIDFVILMFHRITLWKPKWHRYRHHDVFACF